MPGGGQGPGFCFAIADDAGDDERWIVEHGPERMAEGVPQLATFVDRPRAFRRSMTGYSAGKREPGKELLEPDLIPADGRIDLAVRALEVRVAHDRRAA